MILSNNLIIWIIFYLIYTMYLYFWGIKIDWQELRIANGVAKDKNDNYPSVRQKIVLCERRYSNIYIRMILLSFLISIFVISFYYLITSRKEVNDLSSCISTAVSLLFIYSMIMGAPINSKDLIDRDNMNMYNRLMKIISNIKNKSLKNILNCEKCHIRTSIKGKIKEWYSSDRNELGALILRIDSDFFNKMLPENCDEGIKELMRQTSQNILKLYASPNSNASLLDELINLFDVEMIKHGTDIIQIAEFLDNHQIVSQKITKQQIESYVKENTAQNKPPKGVVRKSLGEVEDILNNISISEISLEDIF